MTITIINIRLNIRYNKFFEINRYKIDISIKLNMYKKIKSIENQNN